jgi:microcystin-dependent protein
MKKIIFIISLVICLNFSSTIQGQQDSFIGEVQMFAGNFAPRNWALCEGQLLPISQNTALFSIIGTTYGGDGRTTFALPDLRGRVVMHNGSGPGLSSYNLGQHGGAESVTLNQNQIPSHTHTDEVKGASPVGRGQSSNTPEGTYWAEGASYATSLNTSMAANAVQIANTGGGQSHENRAPYMAVNYIICLNGVFPSRN